MLLFYVIYIVFYGNLSTFLKKLRKTFWIFYTYAIFNKKHLCILLKLNPHIENLIDFLTGI